MDPLTAARAQMAVSLGFHMVFAAAGIAMPLFMLIAEGLYLRSGKQHFLHLAKKWAKATGLLFAIGAVSGTALAFELGLLWPRWMALAGSTIGPAFALEGLAFFVEAIFLGLYLYGWNRLSPWAHWWTGVPVAISGLLSGALVVAVNSWMQYPVGAELDSAGRLVSSDPWATFRSPFWIPMAIHSSLSCYIAVAFAVAGVYASGMLRGRHDNYHRSAITLAMAVGTVTAVLQLVSGDLNARMVARYQPIKLAAMEALFQTQAGAPLAIGGIPDPQERKLRFAIEIPRGLSMLATHDPNAVIKGLDDFPQDEIPHVLWVHLAFQLMVGCGVVLIALGLWYWWRRWRGAPWQGRLLLWAMVLCSPLGFIGLEAGWMVSELGRQPWIIHGIMRTAEGVTPSVDVPSSLLVFSALYLGLAVTLVVLLLRMAAGAPPAASAPSPERDPDHVA